MKNDYEIRGDTTVIFLESNFGLHELLIDTEDLENVLNIPVKKWTAKKTRQSGKYYVKGHLSMVGNKYFHRLLFKPDNDLVIDHIDGNPLNNKRNNIRIVTLSENNKNIRRSRGRDKELPVGVTRRKQCKYVYEAAITVDGKYHFIGNYASIEEATKARLNWQNENKLP